MTIGSVREGPDREEVRAILKQHDRETAGAKQAQGQLSASAVGLTESQILGKIEAVLPGGENK